MLLSQGPLPALMLEWSTLRLEWSTLWLEWNTLWLEWSAPPLQPEWAVVLPFGRPMSTAVTVAL